jgi:FkbM family methyltransferase
MEIPNELKRWVNGVLGVTGYHLTRRPSIRGDIARGRYRWLQQRNIATVLDIGANTGQFAFLMRQVLPHAMIYSFEPLRSCFDELSAKTTGLGTFRCYPFALGSEDGEVIMHHNDFSPSSSILPMARSHREAFPHTAHATTERVTVRALDNLAPQLDLRPPILAKVDVQGYELNVLRGAERTLTLVDVLIVETSFVELYEGQPLFREVYQWLVDHRFLYAGDLEQVRSRSDGTVLQADSIFLKMQ